MKRILMFLCLSAVGGLVHAEHGDSTAYDGIRSQMKAEMMALDEKEHKEKMAIKMDYEEKMRKAVQEVRDRYDAQRKLIREKYYGQKETIRKSEAEKRKEYREEKREKYKENKKYD